MLSIFSCVYWPLVHFLWRAVLLDLLLIVIGQCCPVSICLNRVQLFVTPWTVAHQAPLSMGFCRQEYWGGFPCPPPGDLPNLGIEPQSPAWQADSLPLALSGKPFNWAACMLNCFSYVNSVIPGITAHQAPLPKGFSRQEYWSRLLCPPPGNLPDPGIEPMSLMSNLCWQAGSLPLAPPGKSFNWARLLIFNY